MIISDLLHNGILPFEIDDEKLMKLFSFFLHSAPTIKSTTAMNISEERMNRNWQNFILTVFNEENYTFLNAQNPIEKYFEKYGLNDANEIKKRTHGFICKYKDTNEKDYVCFLRHIRNAIAHNHLYYINAGNRKFIMFDDFNDNTKKQNARILLSQTDLQRLKNEIMK